MLVNDTDNLGQQVWKSRVGNHYLRGIKIEEWDNSAYVTTASQVKISKLNLTWEVLSSEGEILMHFSNEEIVSFDLVDNIIYVYTSDVIPFVLKFSSNDEALEGNERINRILNGENVI